MEISQVSYRERVVSSCCGKNIYENTDECSGCLEHCSFVLEQPTEFEKSLIAQHPELDENQLAEIMRIEITTTQNRNVFELMKIVDEGEETYNNETLKRVAQMLIETKNTTTNLD